MISTRLDAIFDHHGLQVLTVYDLDSEEARVVCKRLRHYVSLPTPLRDTLTHAISIVGGRLAYLSRVSRARDMVEMARHLLTVEKGWLLSQIGLIQDCDDDVMDEVGPVDIDAVHRCDAVIAKMEFLFLVAPARIRENQTGARAATRRGNIERRRSLSSRSTLTFNTICESISDILSSLERTQVTPFQYQCRQIMTRADFLEGSSISYLLQRST